MIFFSNRPAWTTSVGPLPWSTRGSVYAMKTTPAFGRGASSSAAAHARASGSRSSGSLGATFRVRPWMNTIATAAKTHVKGNLLPVRHRVVKTICLTVS